MGDSAFSRGYDDELAGVSWLKNPYSDGTTEARRWVDGKVKAIQDKRMTIYEKARAFGLDERTIELAQQRFTLVFDQQKAVHEAMRRVLIHSVAYDHPGCNVRIPDLRIGISVPDARESIAI